MQHFETEEDLRTLKRAEEVLTDPKRMARVKAMAKDKAETLSRIAAGKGLRAMRGK